MIDPNCANCGSVRQDIEHARTYWVEEFGPDAICCEVELRHVTAAEFRRFDALRYSLELVGRG